MIIRWLISPTVWLWKASNSWYADFTTGTLGLAPARPELNQILFPSRTPAVCVPPGARLRLWDIPEHLQRCLGVGAAEDVIFVQQSAEAFSYRDAVRFANGREILLQCLRCGQRVDVLSVCGAEEETKPLRRTEEYRRLFVGWRDGHHELSSRGQLVRS